MGDIPDIPDYLSPFVAYRTWGWDTVGLKSLNNREWFPNKALEAHCPKSGEPRLAWDDDRGKWRKVGHESPAEGCTCGIYAAKDVKHLSDIGYIDYGVHGEVYLWGRIWDHHLGYRAQYAYPKNIIVPTAMIPWQAADIEERLITLIAYNVDISIWVPKDGKKITVPLWLKATSNYVPEGLDWLLQKRSDWYAQKPEGRALAVGDRISVKDKGIGLIVEVTDFTVKIRMWNTVVQTVNRDSVVWNDKNYRWETDDAGFVFFSSPNAVAAPGM